MLTEQELDRIFSWRPYRDDWPIDRDNFDDKINNFYSVLIGSLIKNDLFDSYYSENGELGNYLEFFCYSKGYKIYEGNAVLVCVSLCAPVACYGQTTFFKEIGSIGWGSLFSPENIAIVSDPTLKEIETEIRKILAKQNLILLSSDFASRLLPIEITENLKGENHNDGNQYLHGIFQKID